MSTEGPKPPEGELETTTAAAPEVAVSPAALKLGNEIKVDMVTSPAEGITKLATGKLGADVIGMGPISLKEPAPRLQVETTPAAVPEAPAEVAPVETPIEAVAPPTEAPIEAAAASTEEIAEPEVSTDETVEAAPVESADATATETTAEPVEAAAPEGTESPAEEASTAPEAGEPKQETSEDKIAKLDKERNDVLGNMRELGVEKTKQQLAENDKARRELLDSIIEKSKKPGEVLTQFEQDVAEAGAQMEALFLEIQETPKIIKAMTQELMKMEAELKAMKAKQKELNSHTITEKNMKDPKTEENIAQRNLQYNKISAQARHMAQYEQYMDNYKNIVAINYNEFIAVNSKLETMIGIRSPFYDLVIRALTHIVRESRSATSKVGLEVRTRQIARRGMSVSNKIQGRAAVAATA